MDTKVLLGVKCCFLDKKIFGLGPRYCLAALRRQLRDVGGDPPGLVAGEQLGPDWRSALSRNDYQARLRAYAAARQAV